MSPSSFSVLFKPLIFILVCSNLPTSLAIGQDNVEIGRLRFLGEYDLPHQLAFKETIVGGLSGIDYDKKNDLYYLVCDDRSGINDARFYSAKIYVSTKGIDSVQFLSTTKFLQRSGVPYPSSKIDASLATDPEAMRFNPVSKQLVWASEGERIVSEKRVALANPSLTITQLDGSMVDEFCMPKNIIMQATERGPRQNGTLEGITFEKNYTSLLAALEEPLYEDGVRADVTETNSWVRFYRFNMRTRKNIIQYAYHLEPIAFKPQPANAFKVNGISDILSIGENKVLVVERSYSTGRSSCTIKVFVADLSNAKNTKRVKSFSVKAPAKPIAKKLVCNMDDLGIYIDNVEGVTLGPKLPNGNRSLIFVTDNNFLPTQKTQFLLFEVLP